MIKKYKTIEESNDPVWYFTLPENYIEQVKRFFTAIEKLSDFRVKPGIQKFKSFEDFNKAKYHELK
ncbi:MAG: hypothetical protein K9J16_15740 [Melioribacteraceae bacterium]|nr:hypothetical protein [Melioribacteraceae bacterium]MCF8356085.1 hypothetical protein [Melioribacteraceae bacterium]MCF8395540.1 hypothetical protein [Melioribacteraceae bacterium]MCF8420612.1 hypothetical protein [Melioribacteraceae bacterium]